MREAGSVQLNVGDEPLDVIFRTPDFMTDTPEISTTTYQLSVAPNPFNPTTEISFALAQAGPAEVRIYDLRGQLVRRLDAGYCEAGNHKVAWYGRDNTGRQVASGVFFATLYRSGERVGPIKKMSLVR